ncbi:MAG: tetratricopeptide repeat protein [Candidatus Thorarchaeota archaeon]
MENSYKQLDEISDAVEQFQRILEIKDKIKNDSTKIIALNVLANIYNDQGELNKTEPLLEQLFGIYEKQEDFIEQRRILSNLGMTNLEKGDIINALSYFKTGLQFFIKENDLEQQGYLHTHIGDTYKLTQNSTAALKYYEKALDIAEQTANLELREFCLNNLRLIQSDLNDYQKVISYLEGMLAILTEKGLGDSQIARNLKDQIEETKSKSISKKRT